MMKKQQGKFFWYILAFLCLMPGLSFAQNIRVEGTVTDETGDAMIGVSVVLKGSAGTGTATDIDGRFVLPNIPADGTLVFSYLGYMTREIKVTGGKIDVRMDPDTQLLDEVVVIAYGSQKKVTITGSVSNIGNEELLKSPVPSLGNAIAGKLPGVQSVQLTGMPGADDPTLRIRGIGTSNNAEPLVMVDGVERPFSQLDPNEVADITILKDASATAVFGVRGANGVILITTRRGEIGKPSISVSTAAGFQTVTKYIEMTNSYTYATAFNNAQIRDGVAPENVKFSPTAVQHFKNRDNLMLYPDTDWFDYMMRDMAWQTQHNVNISGGTELAKYFVSVGMLDQDGLFKQFNDDPKANFRYSRYNYRANLDLNLSKRSQLSINIGGRVENRTFIGEDEQELYGYLVKAVPFSGIGLDDQGRRIIADQALVGDFEDSELGRVYRLGYNLRSRNVVNLDLQYKLNLDDLVKGLSFRAKGSYNSYFRQEKDRSNGYGSGIRYKATTVSGLVDENGDPQVVLVKQGDYWPLPYSEERRGGRDWYAEAAFDYARKFGDHNIGALALYNESKTYYPDDPNSTVDDIYISIPRGYVGLVGRVTYDYGTKYLLDLNVGYNGSENFAKGKRYGLFPSASVGWIPSAEKFWEPVHSVISYMKLRASLGKVGNDKTGPSRFLYLPASYGWLSGGTSDAIRDAINTANGRYNFGTNNNNYLPGARELSLGNPNVTWETAVKQNYGIDFSLINDRLSVSFDYFIENRKDILGSNSAILPSVLGLSSTSINYGHIRNKGYEIVLKWEQRLKDFSYSIAPSLTFARNKIIDQLEVPQNYDHLYRTGYPHDQPFGYELFEFYVAGETERRYQEKYGSAMPDQGIVIRDGDCVFVDLTGDGLIDSNDQHAIGFTEIPEYNGAVNFTFRYKNFDFSMLWIGVTNANRNLSGYYRPQFGATNNSGLLQWVYENSWREDNAASATLPRLTFSNMNFNNRDSRAWLIDASYARLKNAEIGYTLRKVPGIPQIGSLRLYATGNNLLTLSKFKANDPEARRNVTYPIVRLINIGLKVNF